jgi:hypothetical protein
LVGVKAKSIVNFKLRALRAKGDFKGVKAWKQVLLRAERAPAQALELEALSFTSNEARPLLCHRNICKLDAARTMPAGLYLGTRQH